MGDCLAKGPLVIAAFPLAVETSQPGAETHPLQNSYGKCPGKQWYEQWTVPGMEKNHRYNEDGSNGHSRQGLQDRFGLFGHDLGTPGRADRACADLAFKVTVYARDHA